MDMADAYHRGAPEELSKTDFFDFVVSPDSGVDGQLSLNRTLKSMGIFIDAPTPPTPSTPSTIDPPPHSYKLVDEQNNNLVALPTDDSGNFVEHAFWASSCDKEAVRIESEILEDLNKFCWTQDGDLLGGQRGDAIADTDGAIYTLTVLNGDHSTATWYRGGGKDDTQPTGQATLDLDSILSIIPTGEHYQENFDASLTALGGEKPDYATAFDDSGYATKDAYSNNNNNSTNNNNNNTEWKNHNADVTSDDSLLRNALQGLSRYTPTQKKDETALVPLEGALFGEAPPDPLLSTLDAASLPGDYETLKRIAREVAESAGRFCLDPPTTATFAPPQEVVATPSPAARKKASRAKGVAKALTHAPAVAVGGAARKERSLHHCSICSKGFKDKYSVNVHIRTHTGEKPFACSLCGKSFRQKAHLAKHYQTHIAQKHAAAAAAAGGGGTVSGGGAKGGHKRFAKSS